MSRGKAGVGNAWPWKKEEPPVVNRGVSVGVKGRACLEEGARGKSGSTEQGWVCSLCLWAIAGLTDGSFLFLLCREGLVSS